jgi:hypothetical protein
MLGCLGTFDLCLLIVLALPAWMPAAERPNGGAGDFFEQEIRPLLAERCFKCHGDKKVKSGLRLTSRASILRGGNHGPASVPGKPAQSLLIQAVRQDGDLKMPPDGKLKPGDIDKLVRWIELGLPWPEARLRAAVATSSLKDQSAFTEEQHRFWSFQPIKPKAPPAVKESSWPRSSIDRFILAALKLLASPHYGERWGRHWLDVVRYTDSFDARILSGNGRIMDITESHRYRDWVVNAFNQDLPYDQFVMNQIAGDLLPPADPGGINASGIIATGMLAIANWGGGDADKERLLTDIADDQVDVVCRAFLGLTVACARCHDHKFDPIPTEDYYGLAGIFFSSHILENPGPKTDGPPMLRIPLVPASQIKQRSTSSTRSRASIATTASPCPSPCPSWFAPGPATCSNRRSSQSGNAIACYDSYGLSRRGDSLDTHAELHMDRRTFWRITDDSRTRSGGDLDKQLAMLRAWLEESESDEIVQFDRIFQQYWAKAYTWDLWAAAYMIGGGCSDDGFMDFRGWLISKGEKAFENALKDPESLVGVVNDDEEDCQYEGFQYVASQAWENKTGTSLPDFPSHGSEHLREPADERWSEEGDDLERRFPKLWKKLSPPGPRKIRIIAAPPGEAPPAVRAAWVGCILPLVAGTDSPQFGSTGRGVLSGRPRDHGPGYGVLALEAISVLEQRSGGGIMRTGRSPVALARPKSITLRAIS